MDVWGSDDESLTTRDVERTHTKQGYLDGLSNAKESSLQQGFDEGFPKGAGLGIKIGHILSTIKSYDESMFDQCKRELNITRVLHKKYFDEHLEITSIHDPIVKWERICNEVKNQ